MVNDGFRVLVFNPRGVGIPQKTDNLFDYSKILDDMNYVMDYVYTKYPNSNHYLIGFSLGASYGMQYLCHYKQRSKVKAMVSIGNPFDVYQAAASANSWRNIIYGHFLTKRLIERVEFNIDSITERQKKDGIAYDLDKVRKCYTTFKFDKEFTFKFLDYNDSKVYYKLFSCLSDVKDIDVPVLIIHSKNDPISRYIDKTRISAYRYR